MNKYDLPSPLRGKIEHLSNTEKSYFKIAHQVAMQSNHPQHKIGCIVVLGHRIISSGHNSKDKTHAFQVKLDKKYFNDDKCKGPKHAEIDALLPLITKGYDLRKATLYIVREKRYKTQGMAHPCSRCMSVIKKLGIRKLKYTTDDGYANEVIIY